MAPGNPGLARNALTSYALRGLLGLSALLLTPYLFRRLGLDGFGTWSVMFTLATVAGMLELAFTAGVARVLAHYRGAEGHETVQDALSGSVALAILAGVLVATILAAVGVFASGLAASGLEEEFRTGLLAIAGAALARWPCLPAAGALIGYGRYDLVNVSRGLEILGVALLAVVAVEAGWGVLGIAGGYAAATALAGLLLPVLLRLEDRRLRIRPQLPEVRVRGAILGTTPWVTLGESARFASQQFDTVLISAIRSAGAAAPFAAAIKLQSALQSLAVPFLHLVMPMVSDLHSRGPRKRSVGACSYRRASRSRSRFQRPSGWPSSRPTLSMPGWAPRLPPSPRPSSSCWQSHRSSSSRRWLPTRC